MGQASPEKHGDKLAGSPGKTEERTCTGAQPGDMRTRGIVRNGEKPARWEDRRGGVPEEQVRRRQRPELPRPA